MPFFQLPEVKSASQPALDRLLKRVSPGSIMLTSGEAAATSFSQDGGTRARVARINREIRHCRHARNPGALRWL